MSEADVDAENDCFLERSGPPTLDFPFHRDAYYMLESYMPNRGWNSEDGEWKYMPASQHDRVGFLSRVLQFFVALADHSCSLINRMYHL